MIFWKKLMDCYLLPCSVGCTCVCVGIWWVHGCTEGELFRCSRRPIRIEARPTLAARYIPVATVMSYILSHRKYNNFCWWFVRFMALLKLIGNINWKVWFLRFGGAAFMEPPKLYVLFNRKAIVANQGELARVKPGSVSCQRPCHHRPQ